jgi:uncharacterized membrane protein
MTAAPPAGFSRDRALELAIARVLTLGTYVSVALLAIGTLLLFAAGRSPLDPAPALTPATLLSDVVALRPAGLIWLGLIGSIATPAARVRAALVGYVRLGDRIMAGVALAILVVIAAGVASGTLAS